MKKKIFLAGLRGSYPLEVVEYYVVFDVVFYVVFYVVFAETRAVIFSATVFAIFEEIICPSVIIFVSKIFEFNNPREFTAFVVSPSASYRDKYRL